MAELPLLRSRLLAAQGIVGVFTTRRSDVGDQLSFAPSADHEPAHVMANMQRLIAAIPLPRAPLRLRQVHGDRILRAEPGTPDGESADAVLTDARDLPLAIQTADCLPMLLAAPAQGLIAAVHAGWRGTAQAIAAKTVQRMLACGAHPHELIACLGPCIGPCCFQIGDDCAKQLSALPLHRPFIRTQAGRCTADLAGMNIAQLRAAGLARARIEHLRHCTCCEASRFFSYRREREAAGRQLAVVVRPSGS